MQLHPPSAGFSVKLTNCHLLAVKSEKTFDRPAFSEDYVSLTWNKQLLSSVTGFVMTCRAFGRISILDAFRMNRASSCSQT